MTSRIRIIVLNDFPSCSIFYAQSAYSHWTSFEVSNTNFFGSYFSLSNKVTTCYITVHTLFNRVLSVIKKDARLLFLFLFFTFCFLSLGAGDTFHFSVSLFSCGLSFSLGSTDPDCRQYKTCTECILGSPECSWCEDRVSSIVLFRGKSL